MFPGFYRQRIAGWKKEKVMIKKVKNKDTKDGSFVIPEGITKIGNYAFSRCKSLEYIIVPKSVTEIRLGAFSGCTSLKKVSLPKKVKLGIEVFYGCPADLEIEYRD